jgi:hypothetical protein
MSGGRLMLGLSERLSTVIVERGTPTRFVEVDHDGYWVSGHTQSCAA